MSRAEVKFSDGTTGTALVPGTRIHHRGDPTLTGTIRDWEYHESGALSPFPYTIEWDDRDRAREVRGMFFFWGSDEGVEEVAGAEVGGRS